MRARVVVVAIIAIAITSGLAVGTVAADADSGSDATHPSLTTAKDTDDAGSEGSDDTDDDSGTDADTDTDASSNDDTNSDTDTDGSTDSSSDADTSDTDTDGADTETDADTNSDSDTDGTDNDTDSDTDDIDWEGIELDDAEEDGDTVAGEGDTETAEDGEDEEDGEREDGAGEEDGIEAEDGANATTASGAFDGRPFGIDPSESAGAGAAAGAGALASGVLARRLLLSGTNGGAAAASTTAEAATATDSGTARSLLRSGRLTAERAYRAVADRLWRIVGAAGYLKWAGEEPLEHDTRAALYDHVQSDPGTYLSAFADVDSVDASLASARYHLDILERESLVVSEKRRGKRRYYPVGTSPDALEIALDEETPSAILEALSESTDTVSGLADRVDRHPSTVTHHLDRLEEEGLVERRRDGESVVNRLTPGVEQLLSDDPEVASTATGGPTAGD